MNTTKNGKLINFSNVEATASNAEREAREMLMAEQRRFERETVDCWGDDMGFDNEQPVSMGRNWR